MVEIERKFLVTSQNFKNQAVRKTRITQGFLNTNPERTVRVRLRDDQGYITVKGASNNSGTTRFEWEKKILAEEAIALLNLCEDGVIEKVRYEIELGDHLFEVDEFTGDNTGLIIAEVELHSENETFKNPVWLGKEVTGDARYYNSQLSQQPYHTWNKKQ